MRKFVIALAAAGTALAFASPAMAQYYPQPQPYGQPYGYANDYGNPFFNRTHALQMRVDALQNRIRWMDRANVIRDRSADRLKEEARDIEKRLHRASRYGLNPYEASDIERRLARLEQRVQYASSRLGGRYGYSGYNNSNGGYYGDHDRDHDRDGRDDRWEDDQGHDHDD